MTSSAPPEPSTPPPGRTTDAKRGRGRPRDPELEDRALRATLDVFGEKGWAGLTIDEVATRSRAGKSSIYLRWPDKATLLASALRRVQAEGDDALGPEPADAPRPAGGEPDRPAEDAPDAAPAADPAADDASDGDASDATDDDAPQSVRDYLVAHGLRRAQLYLGPFGLAMLRLYVEARAHPTVFAEIRHDAITTFVLDERHRVEDAIRDGELPAGASAVQLLDAVEGAILMHVLVTPPELLERVHRTMPEYVSRLVDAQLAAVAHAGSAPTPPGS
ncbi:TetR/AcrR family transcriptional regulator [Actinotalea sp. JY-7876]|uniref:TetR/AcrR family transcriptional regulator n=3 Tax=unclassified Actinotalea TaxID=2638618 RepID=UPI0015F3B672|nr:TetR/AcrR family transcriptional regulator [Actinotalea sp. JY-7876]